MVEHGASTERAPGARGTAVDSVVGPTVLGLLGLLGLLGVLGFVALGAPATAARAGEVAGLVRPAGCLPDGSGYFRAHIRGAMTLDLDWHNAELECAGGTRAAGGVRLSFAGPLGTGGRRLRLVLGVSGLRPASARQPSTVATWHALPTNLTVIVEGAQRLFATRGDDKCTMDSLRLEPLAGPAGSPSVYRAVARGFCTGPASGITRNERILLTRFDFAGRIVLDRDALSSPPR